MYLWEPLVGEKRVWRTLVSYAFFTLSYAEKLWYEIKRTSVSFTMFRVFLQFGLLPKGREPANKLRMSA